MLEVHVLAFAEEHERDQGDYGHRAQVPAKCLDAEVHDQGVVLSAEQQAAERAGQEARREGDEGQQRGEHRVGLGDIGEENESEIACRGAWPPTVR